MQPSTPPRKLPTILVRRRNSVVVSAALGILLILPGLSVNINFTQITHDNLMSLIGMAAICLAPFLGIPAIRIGGEDLERIQKKVIPASLYRITWWGRRLGMIATACNAMLLLLFVGQVLAATGNNQMREVMVTDLNNLIHAAVSYRKQSVDSTGSGGSYEGFALNPVYANIQDRSYSVTVLSPDTVQFHAIWREDPASSIDVMIGPDGEPVGRWVFRGKFTATTNDVNVSDPEL